MKREGAIKIHETSVNVWEGPVDEKGMRKAFRALLGCLRKRGYTVRQDPRTLKDFPSIARGHWLVNLGDLQAQVDHTGRHIQVEYFQDLNVENPSGGRYDFSKYSRMDRRMRLRLIIEIGAIVAKFKAMGYDHRLNNGDVIEPTPLGIRDLIDPPSRCGTLESFWDRWNFEFDWKRGGRWPKDKNGWPDAKSIGNHKDRDGVPILNGELRYLHDRGNLKGGIVRPNMNGMWSVGDFTYVPSYELFLDPTGEPRRKTKDQAGRLRTELDKSLEACDYPRVSAIAGALAKVEASISRTGKP